MFIQFPYYFQHDAMDCGATCLRMIVQYYGKSYSDKQLQKLCAVSHEGVSLLSISDAAQQLGFRTVSGRITLQKLIAQKPFPCILHWNQEHFVVLYAIKKKWNKKLIFYIADPGKGLLTVNEEKFKDNWLSTRSDHEEKGILLALQPTPQFYDKKDGRKKKKSSFIFLYGYMHQYKRLFFQLVLGLVLGSILQLLFPFLTQAIVDIGIADKNIGFIYLILIGQLVLVLSSTSIDFIRRWILLHISIRINISLLSDFIIKLMKLPMSFFDTKQIGDLLQRMNDHDRVEHFLTSQTLNVLFSVFSFVVFGIVLLYYSTGIFLIFLLCSILYALWIILFLKRRRLLDYEYFDQRALNQNKTMQLLNGMQEIKLQDCERRRRWEWEDIQAGLFQINMKSLKLQQLQESGAILINQIKNIIITIVAATSVVKGELSLGMMLAIQYIIGQLNSPVEQLLGFIYSWQDVKISLERMSEIHEQQNEEAETTSLNKVPNTPKDIYIRNVSYLYDGKRSPKVLKNISLYIPKGKITAIVGASGSGKTTLMKLLLGYYQPIEGDILIDDTNLKVINLKEWRRKCGVVMQEGYIFTESIARNIAIDDNEINTERLAEASRIACTDFIDKLPLRYNTIIGTDGQGLSQGQKQRILIARAVYKNPLFLFFDEATNSLDANNERAIIENLNSFYQGKTVVIVAHRLSTVRNADQIVVLNKGEIIETGTHDSLVKQRGAYFELVKNQLELGS